MVKGLVTGQQPRPASNKGPLEHTLVWAVRVVALLLVLASLGLAVFDMRQRYSHDTVSVVDRDIALAESQIRQRPDAPELRVAIANLYLGQRRYDEAIAQAEQVLRVRPGHVEAGLALAQAHFGNGTADQAASQLRAVAELNRDGPMAKSSLQLALVHQFLARLYLEQGQLEQAVSESQQALEIDRTNADTLFLLGEALAAQQRLDEALLSYRQALRFVPDFPEVYASMSRIYEQQGDTQSLRFARGMLLYSAGEYGRAAEELRQGPPDLVEAHLGLAMALEKQGRGPEALQEYRMSLALDASSIAARQAIARLGGQP